MREFLSRSWINPKIERRHSPIDGWGTFTREAIAEGEVVFIFGGVLMTLEDLETGRAAPHSVTDLGNGLYLGHSAESGNSLDDYINHSCTPNSWMLDEVTVAAMREIKAGEEVTVDYAMYLCETSIIPWDCRCGSPNCRTRPTANDWQIPEVRLRYDGHFAPFIQEKIERHKFSNNGHEPK